MEPIMYKMIVAYLFGSDAVEVLEKYPSIGHDDREVLISLITDFFFTCTSRFMARAFANASAEVHTYSFGYKWDSAAWGNYYSFCKKHSCHGSELPFVFDSFLDSSLDKNATVEDKFVASQMNANWSSFIADVPVDTSMPWPPF